MISEGGLGLGADVAEKPAPFGNVKATRNDWLDRALSVLQIEGVCGVFYDLTSKPPATIEWE